MACIHLESRRGGLCTVVNPWPARVRLRFGGRVRILARRDRFTFLTHAGDAYILEPEQPIVADQPLAAIRNNGPKWPLHTGPGDTALAYLERIHSFGMLGLAIGGQNPTRSRVQEALLRGE